VAGVVVCARATLAAPATAIEQAVAINSRDAFMKVSWEVTDYESAKPGNSHAMEAAQYATQDGAAQRCRRACATKRTQARSLRTLGLQSVRERYLNSSPAKRRPMATGIEAVSGAMRPVKSRYDAFPWRKAQQPSAPSS
jgi:hypothetical protein